jgi:hypothetical protein
MIKWKSLFKRIPHRVQVGRNTFFEVVWVDDFKDGKTLGETRFDPPQIAIKTGEPQKETVHTYIHELLHSISDTHNVGLSESQVEKLEKALHYVLKPDNVFKKEE